MNTIVFSDTDRLVCASNAAHRILVVRSSDHVIATCLDPACVAESATVVASLCWYDDHRNLSLLFDWLGDLSAGGFRHVAEKPWNYEDEYRTAVAARDHEVAEPLHQVWKAGSSDTAAYCDSECEWRFDAEAVEVAEPVEPERLDMSGSTPGAER